MVYDAVASLPDWLLAGLALGVALALLIGSAFAIGPRLFPDSTTRGTRSSGEDRRRAEIRDYLTEIGEEFVENYPVAGRPVAFYLPERDVAITFDAQHYFVVDRTNTHAILVEYELPGYGIGPRLPFETPEIEPEPELDPATQAFETLGLDASATPEEVNRAYREQVKDVHPDHGGDRESFEQVREAYTVAKERAG